jgi:prepilin-type processing-associated H-X9-DG protein
MMLFCEEGSDTIFETLPDPAIGSSDDGWYSPGNGFSTRHTNGSNISFVDGHAKWFTPGAAETAKVEFGGGTACP